MSGPARELIGAWLGPPICLDLLPGNRSSVRAFLHTLSETFRDAAQAYQAYQVRPIGRMQSLYYAIQ